MGLYVSCFGSYTASSERIEAECPKGWTIFFYQIDFSPSLLLWTAPPPQKKPRMDLPDTTPTLKFSFTCWDWEHCMFTKRVWENLLLIYEVFWGEQSRFLSRSRNGLREQRKEPGLGFFWWWKGRRGESFLTGRVFHGLNIPPTGIKGGSSHSL